MIRDLNKITECIIGAAMVVHRELGPGLLESAYEACLAYELAERGLYDNIMDSIIFFEIEAANGKVF